MYCPAQTEEAPKAEPVPPAEPTVPETPTLLVKGRLYESGERVRVASLSLDGLLDYEENDKEEGTVELSLFAEAFQEMLSRDFGEKILGALYAER